MQKLYFHSYIFSSYNDFKAQQYYRFNILRLEFIFCFIDSSNRNDIYIYTYINTVVSLLMNIYPEYSTVLGIYLFSW